VNHDFTHAHKPCQRSVAGLMLQSLVLRLASSAKSVPDVVNPEKPQSKQTKTFGKAKTPGLSMFLRPRKWIIISVMNSA
jgi:hypothetical protein